MIFICCFVHFQSPRRPLVVMVNDYCLRSSILGVMRTSSCSVQYPFLLREEFIDDIVSGSGLTKFTLFGMFTSYLVYFWRQSLNPKKFNRGTVTLNMKPLTMNMLN